VDIESTINPRIRAVEEFMKSRGWERVESPHYSIYCHPNMGQRAGPLARLLYKQIVHAEDPGAEAEALAEYLRKDA
jgi:hypothetical protein